MDVQLSEYFIDDFKIISELEKDEMDFSIPCEYTLAFIQSKPADAG
jgi:hypothetical protein